jgi:hypothetical protein
MIYACPTWEYAADAHLLKLQRYSLPGRRIQVRDLHVAFKIHYAYDYLIKLWRKQAEVIHA